MNVAGSALEWSISGRCGHSGCTKAPSFGVDNSKKVGFCSRDGMDLKNKREVRSPWLQKKAAGSSFGVDGSNKEEFCSERKRDGWKMS